MKVLACIFVGAGFGAVARYGMQVACNRHWPNFPAGTMLVNFLGCLCMGALLAYTAKNEMTAEARGLLAVGFLGGFTTFSAFAGESLALLQKGALGQALIYAVASALGCILLCALGFALTSRILP